MKKRKHSKKTQKSQTENYSKGANDFFKGVSKYVLEHHWLQHLLLIFVVVFVVSSIRATTWSLKGIEYNYEKNYDNYLRQQIKKEILKNFVVAPPENQLNQLIEKQLKELKNSPYYYQNLKNAVSQAKSRFKNDLNETYLLAIDPYYYFRRVRNLINKGTVCDEIRDGKCYDNHMIAPLGVPTSPSFHDYFTFYFYKFIKLFDKKHSLMGIMFFVPVVVMVLSALVAYGLGYELTKSKVVALLFAMFIGLNTSILSRTIGGFSDTDSYNILFPLLVVFFVLKAYHNKDNLLKMLIYLFLGSISLSVFSFAWSGWWFILDVILGAVVLEILYQFTRMLLIKKHKKTSKRESVNYKVVLEDIKKSVVFILAFLILAQVALMFNHRGIVDAILAGKKATQLKVSTNPTLWPNVLTTVAELNFGTINDIIDSILKPNLLVASGWNSRIANAFVKFLMLLALIGISVFVFELFKGLRSKSKYSFGFFLFIVWFVVMSYATLKGVRFAMYVVTPYSVFVAFGIFMVIGFIQKYIDDNVIRYGVLFFIVILMIIPFYLTANVLAMNSMPSMCDGWWNSLTYIKNHSEPNAIINSWWDFGHWFKAIADRPVTFDGASQNTPMAHWIGKVLQTNDFKLALAILRMLDCHSNGAFDALDGFFNDTGQSVKVLYKILKMSKNDAEAYLERLNVSKEIIDKVIERMYCKPPEDFFITSQDMVYKAGVWGHFGLWDFEKAKMWQVLKHKNFDERKQVLVGVFNLTPKKANEINAQIEKLLKSQYPERAANSWISPWPSYLSANTYECKTQNDTIVCDLNVGFRTDQGVIKIQSLIVNISDKDNISAVFKGSLVSNYFSKPFEMPPRKIYIDDFNITKSFNTNMQIGATIKNNRCVVSDYRLVGSIFTMLFYFEDGKQYFEKVYKTNAVSTGKIIVWKVNWSSLS